MPPQKKKGQGFQSAAGLIRYFDSEVDKGLVLKPTYIVGAIIATVVVVTLLKIIWPV
ncbi:preprotein translocase subunit Sec61beta [Methanomassiliicoccus luminyensis]|jgi:preprotein translocase subunit Sec61beta|uniref:preprotein translocase subunit Sec61beta n=1 Tax=Methanomassiliicoccus luminyensis TaxID=1080712 RepID=UPI00036243B2|nr:preprotein translocase subunit Sec61beta [Methanomassiliicoccus luminyensis]